MVKTIIDIIISILKSIFGTSTVQKKTIETPEKEIDIHESKADENFYNDLGF